MSEVVNGYTIRVTRAAIESFLALYGDRSRYPGDTADERRRDAELAAQRLRLLPSDSGGVLLVATRTDSRAELSVLGFMETYDRNSEKCTMAMAERLPLALTPFVSRADEDEGQQR
ncbi:hypothetical protein V5F40_21510 [Xanthobacter sp. DSM 14520]|uniref:hypothetical protein n=1 Tax=Xanthobacter autotrophicus (strain ATCC BAA-1158 / Py2) TaxID=78245 RepID=UPI0037283CAF